MLSAPAEPALLARTVLVTGAAGFVGRRLAQLLAEAGWKVTGLDRALPSSATAQAQPPWSDFLRCDLLDDESLAKLVCDTRFAAIVHLAGVLPGRTTRAELFAVNVGGTSAVLSQCARSGCHLVLFSSGLVYGNQPGPFREEMPCLPLEPYGQSKLAAETIARSWGSATRSPVTILRPSVVYGPGAPPGMLLMSLLQSLQAGKPFAMTAGEQLRDFLHVDDAASAVIAVLGLRREGIWNLASGESRSVRDVAQLAADIAGHRGLLRMGELPYRNGETFDYRMDPSALRLAAQWQPRIGLSSGLERLWKDIS